MKKRAVVVKIGQAVTAAFEEGENETAARLAGMAAGRELNNLRADYYSDVINKFTENFERKFQHDGSIGGPLNELVNRKKDMPPASVSALAHSLDRVIAELQKTRDFL